MIGMKSSMEGRIVNNSYVEDQLPFPIIWPDYECCGMPIEESQQDMAIMWTDYASNIVIRASCGVCGKAYSYKKNIKE